MPLALSRHARRRMQLYDISEQQVTEVLATPDHQEPSIRGRTNATKIIAGRLLRVTYVEEEQSYVVITVTPLEVPEEMP